MSSSSSSYNDIPDLLPADRTGIVGLTTLDFDSTIVTDVFVLAIKQSAPDFASFKTDSTIKVKVNLTDLNYVFAANLTIWNETAALLTRHRSVVTRPVLEIFYPTIRADETFCSLQDG